VIANYCIVFLLRKPRQYFSSYHALRPQPGVLSGACDYPVEAFVSAGEPSPAGCSIRRLWDRLALPTTGGKCFSTMHMLCFVVHGNVGKQGGGRRSPSGVPQAGEFHIACFIL